MRKHIIWKNRPGVNGYGDVLNRLSYFYRLYENQVINCSFRDKIINWKRINLVRKHVLKHNPNFRMFCTQPRLFERECTSPYPSYLSPIHNYWPARISHNNKTTNKIAFHFYENHFPKSSQKKLLILDFFNKVYPKLYELEKSIYDLGYEIVRLWDTNANRGFKVIKDPVECIQANMEILQDCDYYVGSEGFMAHVCRSMRVPGLFFRSDIHTDDYKAISKSLEQPIHHIVSSSEQILFLLQKNT